MGMLQATTVTGRVTSLLINKDATDLTSAPVPHIELDYTGFPGDIHSGLTRKSCVRVREQYPKNTEIRNTRQISALSLEELKQIAEAMQIERIDPSWVGANLIVSGIPHFSRLPPSSRLIFQSGASLVVDMENAPCKFPGEIIDRHFPGKGLQFAKKAQNQRGITLWVERTGQITVGDEVRVHIPPIVRWPNYSLEKQKA